MDDDAFALMASDSPDALVLMTTQGEVLHWSKGAHAISEVTVRLPRGTEQ